MKTTISYLSKKVLRCYMENNYYLYECYDFIKHNKTIFHTIPLNQDKNYYASPTVLLYII